MTDAWALVAAPTIVAVIVAVITGGLNMWANTRVTEERDRGHENALKNLTTKLDSTHADVKQSLANFGQRLGDVQDEVIRLQAGLGMGGEHGLFAEVRDVRRALDELRRSADAGITAVTARVTTIEAQATTNSDRLKRVEEQLHSA